MQCAKLLDVESNDSAAFNLDDGDGPWTPIQISDSTELLFTCWSSGTLASEGRHTLNIKNVNGGTPLRIDKITYMVVVPETTSTTTDCSISTVCFHFLTIADWSIFSLLLSRRCLLLQRHKRLQTPHHRLRHHLGHNLRGIRLF